MRGAVDGLVLREMPSGENDRLLVVLTAEYGTIRMCAKGARSVRSKLSPLCRVFTYANFEFYEKNGMRWLSGGSVNDSFFGLQRDIEGFSLAAYLMSVTEEITGEGVEAHSVLRTALNSLYLIEKEKKSLALIKAAFEIFAAVQSGVRPDVSRCADCGCEPKDTMYLDVMNGCIRCVDCVRRSGAAQALTAEETEGTRRVLLPITPSAFAAFRYVLFADPSRLFAFELKDDEELATFGKVAEQYLLHHLGRGFDTLDFYHSVSMPIPKKERTE